MSRYAPVDPLVGSLVDEDAVIWGDGRKRDMIAINGQFPGPTIEVMEGAKVRLSSGEK